MTIYIDPDTRTLHVGNRRFPVVDFECSDTRHFIRRWCLLRLETKWQVSITYGTGSYSVNKYVGMDDLAFHDENTTLQDPSPDCEIMVTHEDEGVITWSDEWNDSVKGWVTGEELLGFIDMLNQRRLTP